MSAPLWDTEVMGRHSAPEPDFAPPEADAGAAFVLELSSEPAPSGRHARVATEAAPPVQAEATAAARVGDLAMLRRSVGLRWRCAAAVVLTFLIYTSVLVTLRRTDVYLIWVWIPAIVSGIAVGALLDAVERRARSAGRAQQEPGPPE